MIKVLYFSRFHFHVPSNLPLNSPFRKEQIHESQHKSRANHLRLNLIAQLLTIIKQISRDKKIRVLDLKFELDKNSRDQGFGKSTRPKYRWFLSFKYRSCFFFFNIKPQSLVLLNLLILEKQKPIKTSVHVVVKFVCL